MTKRGPTVQMFQIITESKEGRHRRVAQRSYKLEKPNIQMKIHLFLVKNSSKCE